jgi:hypothetical protein
LATHGTPRQTDRRAHWSRAAKLPYSVH